MDSKSKRCLEMKNTDVEYIIKTKREIRKYKPEPIPDEIIRKILEAGRLSASSRNSQPWHFIAITDKEKLSKIAENAPTGRYIADAPLAIAILLDKTGFDSDGGRTVQNMMLEAWKYHIGSVWVSNFSNECLPILGLTKHSAYRILTIIPFGYVQENDKPKGRKNRKPFDEVVSLNGFGKKFT